MRRLSLSHGLVEFLVCTARIQRVRFVASASRLKFRTRVRLARVERGVLLVRDIVVSSRPCAVVGSRLEGFAILGVLVGEPKSSRGVIQAGDARCAASRKLCDVTSRRCHDGCNQVFNVDACSKWSSIGFFSFHIYCLHVAECLRSW